MATRTTIGSRVREGAWQGQLVCFHYRGLGARTDGGLAITVRPSEAWTRELMIGGAAPWFPYFEQGAGVPADVEEAACVQCYQEPVMEGPSGGACARALPVGARYDMESAGQAISRGPGWVSIKPRPAACTGTTTPLTPSQLVGVRP